MFYKKKGFPDEGEILLCTVKKVLHNSIFATLDEYENKEGIIHISEIAPGRIRTIRDFVREGKKVIVKALRVNAERNHIELSLRRVTTSLRMKKSDEVKQEQKAEKILEFLAKELKTDLASIYKKVGYKIIEEYGALFPCFQEIVESGDKVLQELGVDKTIAKKLSDLIQSRIKPPEVSVTKVVSLKSRDGQGIDIIKKGLLDTEKFAKEKKYELTILYLGAPKFRVTIKATNYKKAESEMEEITTFLGKFMQKKDGEFKVAAK